MWGLNILIQTTLLVLVLQPFDKQWTALLLLNMVISEPLFDVRGFIKVHLTPKIFFR